LKKPEEALWCTHESPALGRQKHKDHEFQASLSYIVQALSQKNINKLPKKKNII
jgi:hypothetical protein